jgi:hypothetical protein
VGAGWFDGRVDVDEAATRLYAMPLDQFIATRRSLVAEARAAGEREVAREVGALRKPSVAAWLVNQLARLDPAPVAGLTSLGDRLRDAQSAMRGSELKTLARERSAVVEEAMARVSALAGDRGVGLSPGVTAELHDTFVAALATAEAGGAVRSGRLVRALSYAGFGDVDLDEALAGSLPSAAEAAGAAGAAGAASGREAESSGTKAADRSAVEAREAERHEARRREAEEVVAARREELDEVAEEQTAAETHIGELEEQLEAAQAALMALVGRKAKAQRALREAEGALAALESDAEG